MKFMVCVDLEGITLGYCRYGETISKSPNFEWVKKQASREVNSAVSALFDNGATEVVVWDNHGYGCNLDFDLIDERCSIAIGGSVNMRYPLLDSSYSGVLFVGYHAMASHVNAVCSHTYSSSLFQYIKFNGVEYGEAGIDGALAGEKGVPVIFLSGDNTVIEETKAIMPWIETVETKKSLSHTRILSKHPNATLKEIYSGVAKAVQNLSKMQLFTIKTPCELEVRYKSVDVAEYSHLFDSEGKFFELVDGYTRRGKINSVEELMLKW